ncbi:MAG: diol dehydratase small subunit [Clostridiales bacterium]|nr:diol dehydratase small subunit [Clostridiales bacterium]
MQDQLIDSLVAKIAADLKGESSAPAAPKPVAQAAKVHTETAVPKASAASDGSKYTVADYPLMEKHSDIIKTPTGKSVSDISLEAVSKGNVSVEDVRISAQMLQNQADIAESAGKKQIAENLRRAAEMTAIEDDVVIKMYDMLRPNRATKEQLTEMAETLRNQYHAPLLSQLVSEACAVYEKRGILLK